MVLRQKAPIACAVMRGITSSGDWIDALTLELAQPATGARLAEVDKDPRADPAEDDEADHHRRDLANQRTLDDRSDQLALPRRLQPVDDLRHQDEAEQDAGAEVVGIADCTATRCSESQNAIRTGRRHDSRRSAAATTVAENAAKTRVASTRRMTCGAGRGQQTAEPDPRFAGSARCAASQRAASTKVRIVPVSGRK